MNSLRRCVPAFALGLMMALAGAAFARATTPATGDKKDSCCCMSSGCCGDSCNMKKKDGMKNHAMADDKDGCCGCCGDSCDMKKKDGMKNHAMAADKDGCCGCCGDSCDMKKKDGSTNTNGAMNMSSDKHESCCCGDSCEMKDMKKSG